MSRHKLVTRTDAHPPGLVADYLPFTDQDELTATASSGEHWLEATSSGLFVIDDAGGQVGPLGTGGGSSAAPALTLGTSNSAGTASTFVATDATIAAFDATAPVTQAFGDSAATGSAAKAARRDHKHGMPADPLNGVAISGTPAASGKVLTSTSTAAADWEDPTSGFADPTTTKGDLIVHGSTTTRIGVGTDGQVLTADSAQALGVKWADATASGGSSSLDVTDGTTTVTGVTTLTFLSGATVADGGSGDAEVTISGGGGGGATTVDATLSADVSMTTGGSSTWYDGPSATFAAGTWFIAYRVLVASGTTGSVNDMAARLWDGTTIYDQVSNGMWAAPSSGTIMIEVSGFAIVTLASSTTLKVSATAIRANATMKRDTIDPAGTTHNATRLCGHTL